MTRRAILWIMWITVGACALAGIALPAQAQDADVSGAWILSFELGGGRRGGGGPVTGTLTLEVDGGAITGTFQREGQENAADVTGTIEGNSITFRLAGMGGRRGGGGGGGQRGGGPTFTGTVEGETMSGEVSFGNRGATEWSARRPE